MELAASGHDDFITIDSYQMAALRGALTGRPDRKLIDSVPVSAERCMALPYRSRNSLARSESGEMASREYSLWFSRHITFSVCT